MSGDVGFCTGCRVVPVEHVPHGGETVGFRQDGLTVEEGAVMDHLCAAANAFGRLRREHPDEARDFCDAVHRAQDLLAVRIARRHYPLGWPYKS